MALPDTPPPPLPFTKLNVPPPEIVVLPLVCNGVATTIEAPPPVTDGVAVGAGVGVGVGTGVGLGVGLGVGVGTGVGLGVGLDVGAGTGVGLGVVAGFTGGFAGVKGTGLLTVFPAPHTL